MSLVTRAALLFAASALPASSSCSTAADCGLLGDCVSSACVCDEGWTGSTCASLNLAPAPPNSGLRQANSSNWCGTILRDEHDPSTFHSYNADFGGCTNGLAIWLTGSRVIHSTSSSPVGPFTPVYAAGDAEVAISAEAHNPQAILAPDGTFLLMDSYAGPDADCPLEANYSTCRSVGSSCAPKMPRNGGVGWWVFHHAASASGPWAAVNVSVDFPCYSENLTPSPYFHKNGTLFIVFHCDADASHNMCDLVMVRGDSWRGPFTRVNDVIWDSKGVAPHPEDPFFWIRTSPTTGENSFHIILHNTPRGIHLFSADGLNFSLQQNVVSGNPQPPFVFDDVVVQSDGTNFTAGRRERPWILFDAHSTRPRVLVTSMQAPAAWHAVFTHAQAVN